MTPAGYSLAQVWWSRAQVVSTSTVQPRSARPDGDLAEHQLGPPDHVGAVAGRHEGEATGLHGGPTLPARPRAQARRQPYSDPMDVLVCAAQVPFMRGGLEMLVDNLVEALRAEGHRAEAVRVPAAWDRERLLDAALAWRMVPLDADVVIATNFPSYFARHPRKVLWLAHQHRAAYDGIDQPWSDLGGDEAGPRDPAPAHRVGHPGDRRGVAPLHDRPGRVGAPGPVLRPRQHAAAPPAAAGRPAHHRALRRLRRSA